MKRRDFIKTAGFVGAGALAFSNPLFAKETINKSKQPNIVLILTDDQGWNSMSIPANPNNPASGSQYYQTPRLKQFAEEGVRFSQAYSAAPTCGPSRHSIQFGRSPSSLQIWNADKIKKETIETKVNDSLANKLKSECPEYATGHFGKWHISFNPDELGYDAYDGSKGNIRKSKDPRDPKFIFSLTLKANSFMEKQVKAKKPFFLQLSHFADHLTYEALPETVEKYKNEYAKKATKYQKDPLWAAMNENLDTGIGMVLDKIDKLGIRDNTFVIITSDNGYESKKDRGKPVNERKYYKAYPQRSHKYTVSEGGIRVPFMVSGPGIPKNAYSSAKVVGTDIYPTILDIVGKINKTPEKVEGASILSHVKSGGKTPISRKDPFFVFKYSKPKGTHDITIVQGDYKLIKDIDTGEVFLFNLKQDIGESKNLANEMPKLTKQMYEKMTQYFKRFNWDESKAHKKVDKKEREKFYEFK